MKRSGWLAMRLADRVVESNAELEAQIVVGPVDHRLRERQRVHPDAQPVHGPDAIIEVVEMARDGAGAQQQPDLDERRFRFRLRR